MAWRRALGRWSAAGLVLLLAGAGPAAAQIEGTWNIVERDPLWLDNDFFGQFRYEMTIERVGDGYVVSAERTGARFGPAPLRDGRFVAEGLDPNRGRARIDIRFPSPDRLTGTMELANSRRLLTGEIDPARRLARAADSTESARQQAADAARRAAEAEAASGATAARLAQAEAERDRLGREVAALRIEVAQLRAAAARPKPPVPATAPVAPAAAAMTLQVIEPPVDPATGSASFRGEAATVVGRIDAPAGVLTLRVNGHEVAPDARGLFRATLPGATRDVEIVAVDRNGVRRAVAFMLVPAPPPTAAAASPAPAADDSARSRCYALAIAPPAPDPSALEVCRAAVQQSPDSAIDHYNLGVALSRLGRHAEAIMSYREAAGRWAR